MRKEILIHATTRINLENIILSKTSQTQKATYPIVLLYDLSKVAKSMETEDRLGVANIRGKKDWSKN